MDDLITAVWVYLCVNLFGMNMDKYQEEEDDDV